MFFLEEVERFYPIHDIMHLLIYVVPDFVTIGIIEVFEGFLMFCSLKCFGGVLDSVSGGIWGITSTTLFGAIFFVRISWLIGVSWTVSHGGEKR